MIGEEFLMNEIVRKSVEEDYKRVNNDTWICNQLEDIVVKYEGYLKSDEKNEIYDYDQGEYDALLAVVQELKELLYKPD